MTVRHGAAWLGLLGALGCHVLPPASGDRATADLMAAARAGTARYQSQEAAIADGYRRVGVEFPAMGEHWVHLARVMVDSFVPAQPPVLTYITVGGETRLAGVAYTALLEEGEHPPTFAPARGYWHEHNGSIVEESFAVGHESHGGDGDTRLAILHAWVWAENPAGLFATDNWTLPFLRLGIAPPRDITAASARAAAIIAPTEEYYRLALEEGVPLSQNERSRVEDVLARYRIGIDTGLAAARRRGQLTADEDARLARVWRSMWDEVAAAAPERSAEVRALRRHLSQE